MERKVFIYSLDCPFTDNPVYIGKAVNIKNRFYKHLQEHKTNPKSVWLHSLIEQGLRPIISEIDCIPESEWEFWERHYISLYKSWGFKLKNQSDGGLKGTVMSELMRSRLSASLKELLSDPTKCPMYGKKHKEETLQKMRENSYWKDNGHLMSGVNNHNYGKYWDESTKDKVRGKNNGMYGKGYLLKGEKNGMWGKTHTPENRAKFSKLFTYDGNPRYKTLENELFAKMVELRDGGMPYAQISVKLGIDKNKVWRELKRMGK